MNESGKWWQKSVVYQVYPKSFNDSNNDGVGDLNGITEKLSYIKELGADIIWLNPIYDSPHVDNGYDISNYRSIDASLGTMMDFDQLLKRSHDLGLKVILDLVVNHTSDQHPWFKESKKSKNSSYHDYYIWKNPVEGHEPNNWGSSFGGSSWEYVKSVGQYYLHLFAKQQPDLNWENPKVRQEVFDVMRFWLDKGIDGFRMDVISLISKKPDFPDGTIVQKKKFGDYYYGAANGPRVHDYLKEMNKEVLSHYDVVTVGETPHTNVEEAVKYVDRRRQELDMVFHFDHMHLDYGEYGKFSKNRFKLLDLKDVLSRWQTEMAKHHGWNSLYWSNHDQARAVSRFGNDGKYRVSSAKMLGTLLHMMQGTPYIYEGEEIGMTNVHDAKISDYNDLETLDIYNRFQNDYHLTEEETMKAIHMKSRDNARTPMQWDESKNAGFSKADKTWLKVNSNFRSINVARAKDNPDSVFYYYQKLIQIRHDYPIITTGQYRLIDANNPNVFSYERIGNDNTLLVICSFAEKKIQYKVPDDLKKLDHKVLISNGDQYEWDTSGDVVLQPYAAVVYLIQGKEML
ncbi:glycoside hydrolase family 13 protein [Pediococcus parvulus]|uniref:glycoside hydrolase family 13 protein n=1 Tax=Pediococcus parvulus TaxID=54062 RepID=UPI00070CB501|nr:alpha-glucosidase [Pediococcus parvulus]MCT3026748.1 alpha-glucosidase [Pediococcus parvulus]GEL89849.1 glucohydrolase [Pediococcus parvulus]GHC09123.1 glucohydrolase [Pediococcus parvulus]